MAIITLNNNSISSITSLPAAISTGALIKISRTDVSGSPSNIDFTNVFSSTYRNYYIIGSGLNLATVPAQIRCRVGASSSFESSSYKATTKNNQFAYNGSVAGGTNQQSTGNFILMENNGGTGQNENDIGFVMNVYTPQVASTNTSVTGHCVSLQEDGGYMIACVFQGQIENTTQFTDIRFFASSGNFGNTGEITVFGIKES
jgi:hypothetical protein